jgi:SAM-dependent methyltransferase
VDRDLSGFYDSAYARGGDRHARWRELGARGKADHVQSLCARAGLSAESVVEVGCGDGALLAELSSRGFGRTLAGFDISPAAVELARSRRIARVESIEVFDGVRLPVADGAFDLGVLSHVLEHVEGPGKLLREVARASRAVIVEVPLERNASAVRASRRAQSQKIGHVQTLDRPAVAAMVEDAGLRVVGDLVDPLRAAVHLYDAYGARARALALAKAGVRRGLFRVSPAAAERAFTLHYACACVPA